MVDELADPARAAARGEEVDARHQLGAETRVWLARHLAEAHLRLGRSDLAEAKLRTVVARFESDEPALLREVRADLEALVAKGPPFAAELTAFLAWFRPKDYTPSADEGAALRAWFATRVT